MHLKAIPVAGFVFAILFAFTISYLSFKSGSPRLEHARALHDHGFNETARLELIKLIYGPTSWLTGREEERAAALHLLGEIAIGDDHLSGAISAWEALIDEHPNSNYADAVQKKFSELRADLDKQLDDLATSAEANYYFEIADRWLVDAIYRAPGPSVDVSHIPQDEAALDWLRQIVERFPNTSQAEIAYERMIEI